MSLGENIKKFRKENGLTQIELANKVSISRSYLADVEHNRYNPSLEVLKSIAKALDTPISDLMDEKSQQQYEIDLLEDDVKGIINKLQHTEPSKRKKIAKMIEQMIDLYESENNK